MKTFYSLCNLNNVCVILAMFLIFLDILISICLTFNFKRSVYDSYRNARMVKKIDVLYCMFRDCWEMCYKILNH